MPVLTIDDVVIGEGQGVAVFTVRMDEISAGIVTVNYTTISGTASSSDYTPQSGTLSFAPGELTKTISIAITNDTAIEFNQSFFVSLSSASGATIGREDGVGIIIDNDGTSGVPNITISDPVIDEGSGFAAFEITLDRGANDPVSLNFATANGTALAGSDFQATSGSLTFAVGETSKTVYVPIINDTDAESAEGFSLVLSSIVGANAIDNQGAATIYSSDQAAVPSSIITVDDVVIGEGQDYVEFLVRLNAPDTGLVTVNYATQSGQASTSDYEPLSGTLAFAPGETLRIVRVPLNDDTSNEPSQEFALLLSGASGATIGRNLGIATLIDNEGPASPPVLTISDPIVDEASGLMAFTIMLDRPGADAVTLNYATVDLLARAGFDYQHTEGTMIFTPGETAKTVYVPIINDSARERTESLGLNLTNVVGAVASDSQGVGLILSNDDSAIGTSVITIDDGVIGEGQAFMDFIVRLDAPDTGTVTVVYSTVSGSASTSDYTGLSGTLAFAPGETSKTIRIPITEDTSFEPGQSFYVNLSSASGGVIGRTFGLGTIRDNEQSAGIPNVSVGEVVIDEGQALAAFVITLDRPGSDEVLIEYTTQNATAVGGGDFAETSGMVIFAPGETAKTVYVPIHDDTAREGTEQFALFLQSVVGGTVVKDSGLATILSSDQISTANSVISVADAFVSEAENYVDFIVSLNAPDTGQVQVNYTTASGSASTSDYDGQSGTLIFAPGETTKTVRVIIEHDTLVEGNQAFTLQLSAPNGATIGRPTATALIIDDDDAGVDLGYSFMGTAGDDTLIGTDFDDSLTGDAGDDVLDGRGGIDSYTGGLGDDVFVVSDVGDTYIEQANQGFDTVISSTNAHTLLAQVERLILVGSAVSGTGNGGANTVIGNALNNILSGGGGDDTISGRLGNDTISGGNGIDRLFGDEGDDDLSGGNDADRLRGGIGNDTLDGGVGNDFLSGDAGDDILIGGDGADSLVGGGTGDIDSLRGGLGDDNYQVQDASDTVVELANQGIDTVRTGIDYTLTAHVERLFISGGARNATGNNLDNTLSGSGGSDTLSGLDGADVLRGNIGRDILLGGNGDDLLDGGEGKDTMTGGAGKDTFQFRFASDLNASRALADTITDFDQGLAERIQLNAIDANINTGTNDNFEWIATGAFSATAGELRFQQIGGDTLIEGDTNGDGVADLVIRLTGLYNLTASDILGASDLQPNREPVEFSLAVPETELGWMAYDSIWM